MNDFGFLSRKWLVTPWFLLACSGTPAPQANTAKAPAPVPSASAAAADPEPFRAKQPAAGKPGAFEFPTPALATLPNGLSVYLVQRPTRVAAVTLWVRHGAASVPKGKSGLAGLTARMLTEGTRKKSSSALAEAVESLGTTLSADASRDASNLGLSCLPPDLSKALGLLAEVVTEPAFNENEFTRVRAEWLDGIRAERQEPQRLSTLVALQTLLGAPHGAAVDGSVPDVEKLTVKDLKEFHVRAYTPDNAAVVIVGPFEKAAVSALVSEAFAKFRGKNGVIAPAAPEPQAPSKLRLLLVNRPGAVQSAIAALQPAPKRSDAGFEARQVMARALGGLFTSRLNLNLREEHAYTYGAFAQSIATRYWGALLVATSVRTDVTAEAIDEIVRELSRAQNPSLGKPFAPDEQGRATADLIFNLGAAIEHPNRIAEQTSKLFVEQLPLDYNARYPVTLKQLPLSAVVDAAAALTPQRQLIVIVGDREKIEPALKQHGYAAELADSKATE